MHTISIKLKTALNGEHKLLYVAKTKTAVYAQKKLLEEQGHTIKSWRYHNGNGWAGGSDDAWIDHTQIVGLRAIIVI